MSAIAFTVRNIHIDPPGLKIEDARQALVNIDGAVELAIDGTVVFAEEINFPELRDQLNRWKRAGYAGDFSFDSMDFEETGIVRFERRGEGFVFASCFQKVPSEAVLDGAAVDAFVSAFDTFCTEALTGELGLDLAALFKDLRP